MSGVPQHEITALRALTGYEQMLEMDRVMKQYGLTETELLEQLNPPRQGNGNTSADAPAFIPDSKEAPKLPSTANLLDKSNFHFEYDPSAEAAQRRSAVTQAILCPGCGVALGIPDIRPIKVTCPECLMESVFDA
mgnify:CR=1 FL=1|tara:strand:+ start:8465 stop:8869 length:405 start_codon:yes stop_codon:yes gene_type:complete